MGTVLVVGASRAEVDSEAMEESMRLWNDSGAAPIVSRSRQQLIRFFDGLELLAPGVVSCSRWHPKFGELDVPEVFHLSGVGRKS